MTSAARLAGEGKPFTLNNNRTVHVRYSMKSLLRLEEVFGGLGNINIDTDGKSPMIRPMFDLLAAGLLHEHDGTGAPLTSERLADLIEPLDFQAVSQVAGQALAEAFPTLHPAGNAPEENNGSPGTTGTTSEPSSSAAPLVTSG